MIKHFGMLLLLLFVATSCLKENTEGCPTGNVVLSLKYTLNVENEDQLKDKIGHISLYIFDDATGLLVKVEPINQERLISGSYATDLSPGSYTLVAWAINGRDMTQGSYFPVEMIDPVADTYTSPVIGRTHIDKFRVRLSTTTTSEGYKTPTNTLFSELYHARAVNVRVTGEEQTINFNFTKNTNLFKVRVEGLDYLGSTRSETPAVSLFVVGTDDRYDARNSAGEPAMPLRYERPVTYPEPNTAQSDIPVLRLDMELHKKFPIELHLRRTDTGRELMDPIDLMALILSMKDKEGNLLFKTQQDIDRWDEFPITLKIGLDLGVSVTIEDFDIEDTEGGLD